MKKYILIAIAALFALSNVTANAKDEKKSKPVVPKQKPAVPKVLHVVPDPVKIDYSITIKEREIIQQHCVPVSKISKKLPPGLAKKVENGGSLPPGWQKKVSRGSVMPPDVLEHCKPLPQEVLVKLPVPPVGTILVTVEGKVARILAATHEILDVFNLPSGPSFPKPVHR